MKGENTMFTISLKQYSETKYYFLLFDVLLKKVNITKEVFLKEAGISPSSYRKARTIEQNVGEKIISQLCTSLNYKNVDRKFIDDFEEFINNIYFNVYYKVYKTYDEDLKKLDELLKENYILFPIIKLIKLFMVANSHIESDEFITKYKEEFLELKKYTDFFNEDLLEIYDILSLLFEPVLPESLLFKTFKNSLVYYSIVSRLCKDKRFVECLFISKKAEEILVKERNYKRLLYLNIKVMYSLSAIHSYQECYELANMQLYTLQSFVNTEFEFNNTIKHLVIASIALKKYSTIENVLMNKKNIYIMELCCLLIAKYHTDNDEYTNMFNYYQKALKKEEDIYAITCIDSYLKNKDKKDLSKLENINILDTLIYAIKISEI